MTDWSNFGWTRDYLLNPWFLFGLWLLGLLIWTLPPEIFGQDVARALGDSKGWIGLATLFVFVLWLVLALRVALPYGQRLWSRRIERKADEERRVQTLAHLHTLNSKEAEAILYCLEHNERSVSMKFQTAPATTLREKGLMIPTSVGTPLRWSHSIPDFVWEYLQNHKREFINELKNRP